MPRDLPKNDPGQEERIARLHAARKSGEVVPAHAKENIEDLPAWARAAMVEVVIGGEQVQKAAANHQRAAGTLSVYKGSPAGQKWIEALEEVSRDPVALSKGLLQSFVVEASANLLWAIEAAKRANDYKEVRVATQNLLESTGVVTKERKESAPSIVINLPTSMKELEALTVESEEIEEAEVEMIEG